MLELGDAQLQHRRLPVRAGSHPARKSSSKGWRAPTRTMRPVARPPEPVRDLDWPADRAVSFGEDVLEIWRDLLEQLRSLPVARPIPERDVHDAVALDVPEEPLQREALLQYLRRVAFEHSTYTGSPGFMAYITGAGTVPGAPADLLAAALNQNVGGWMLSPGASEIEHRLTRWFAAQFGLPEGSGGLLVSGGAVATLVGLKLARDAKAGVDVRTKGVRAAAPLRMYASEEVHDVTDRAADALGLGTEAVRRLETDEQFRLRVDALEAAIGEDLSAGYRPIAVVGSAGTVASGAIDPLPEIAAVCKSHNLWFHVDAAYGGPAVLADDLRPELVGIEHADSIAFDPHKWLYVPHSAGCIIAREAEALARSFAVAPTYLHQDLESTGRGVSLGGYGPQFSRGFQALKVWVSLLAHGRSAYARRISHDAALARYLGQLVDERDEFELAAPVGLSICCFRYVPHDLPDSDHREEYLNRLNERLLTEIQLDGRAYCSNAVLRGRFVLRACIVNFRTEAPDVERLLEVAAERGAEIDRTLRGSGQTPALVEVPPPPEMP
jgi:aromatic-L-amino-acid/L-tryptophan decarboxylase